MNRNALPDAENGGHAGSLDGVELLAALTPAERAQLAVACSWQRCTPRQQILDHGGASREICFVVVGTVRVVNYSASGREISFADIPAGGMVGELSAIDGEPRSANVFSVDHSLIARLGPAPFRRVVETHPEVARTIMQRLARMVRDADRRIMDLSTLGAHNRVHGELLRLAQDNIRSDGSALIEPAPPHADIAARVSTTRETVARVLGDLARDGVVTRRRGALAIPEPARLARLVEDPYSV